MKKFLLFFCFIALSITCKAAKAYPFPVVVTQKDGTQLTVIGHGDEDWHWFTTTDGVLLYQDNTDYYIAKVKSDGDLASTGILAHSAGNRSTAEQVAIGQQNRQQFFAQAKKMRQQHAARREPVSGSRLFPHTGSPRVLVVLAEFQDTTFTLANPKKSFEQYLNGQGRPQNFGNNENQNAGSIKSYFSDISFGQFTPQFDVYGPVQLPENMSVYGAGRSDRMDLFIPAVCNAVKDSLDFSNYDQDNDGYVDLIYVIYAGYGANTSGNSVDCIWPKSGTQSFSQTYNGKKIYRYGVHCELIGTPTSFSTAPYQRINGIGIFCHEFSHCLGLPDFYPVHEASAQTDNQSMEYWSLMDNGEYLRNGYWPTPYTAWEREAMGWMTIETLNTDAELEILPIDDANGKAYRIINDNDATQKEYFIIENIQNRAWNSGQYGHGLIVYHVNYDANTFSLNSNSVNDVLGKPKMAIVPADGTVASSYNIGKSMPWATASNRIATKTDYNNQHLGDPFPGANAVSTLCDTTQTVNFQVYNGEKLNKALVNIQEDGGKITLSYIHDFNTYVTSISPVEMSKDQTRKDHMHIFAIDGRYAGNNRETLPKGIYIMNKKKIVVP